jgi:hypothetical protein
MARSGGTSSGKKRASNARRRRAVKQVGLNAAIAAFQSSIMALVPTPEGQALAAGVGSVIGDVLRRLLSSRQVDRVEDVVRLAAAQVRAIEQSGGKPRADLEPGMLDELAEGTLLAAKDTYEKKKLPFVANLLANAYFIESPIANLVDALHTAEELSYRELCILGVVSPQDDYNGPPLTNRTVNDLLAIRPMTEEIQGIIFDVVALTDRQLIMPFRNGQFVALVGMGDLSPAELRQTYPGRLLFFGMKLSDVPAEDRDGILRVLGADGLAPSKKP